MVFRAAEVFSARPHAGRGLSQPRCVGLPERLLEAHHLSHKDSMQSELALRIWGRRCKVVVGIESLVGGRPIANDVCFFKCSDVFSDSTLFKSLPVVRFQKGVSVEIKVRWKPRMVRHPTLHLRLKGLEGFRHRPHHALDYGLPPCSLQPRFPSILDPRSHWKHDIPAPK